MNNFQKNETSIDYFKLPSSIMIRFKKIYLVPTVIVCFTLFVFLQFIFFANLTESNNSIFQFPESTTAKFNKHIRGRTIKAITQAAELISSTLSGKFIDEQIYELDIPLNAKNNPYLVNLLPFFDIYNQKFQTKLVNRTRHIHNNRINKAIRGIDLKKSELYQEDANGFFKCLNSNVINYITT